MRLRRHIPLHMPCLLLIRSGLSAWIITPGHRAEPSWGSLTRKECDVRFLRAI